MLPLELGQLTWAEAGRRSSEGPVCKGDGKSANLHLHDWNLLDITVKLFIAFFFLEMASIFSFIIIIIINFLARTAS